MKSSLCGRVIRSLRERIWPSAVAVFNSFSLVPSWYSPRPPLSDSERLQLALARELERPRKRVTVGLAGRSPRGRSWWVQAFNDPEVLEMQKNLRALDLVVSILVGVVLAVVATLLAGAVSYRLLRGQ